MGFWVYMLECGDGSYYVGQTDELELRVSNHSIGSGCEYTRKRMPVRLVFADEFPTRDEAFIRERQIKNWSRAKKEALARSDWAAMKRIHRVENQLHDAAKRMRQ